MDCPSPSLRSTSLCGGPDLRRAVLIVTRGPPAALGLLPVLSEPQEKEASFGHPLILGHVWYSDWPSLSPVHTCVARGWGHKPSRLIIRKGECLPRKMRVCYQREGTWMKCRCPWSHLCLMPWQRAQPWSSRLCWSISSSHKVPSP